MGIYSAADDLSCVVATATFESIAYCWVFDFFVIFILKGYIKNFEVHDPHRVGRITVEVQSRVNDCRALTYRQDIKTKDIEKYKSVKLPTRQWGYVVISTPDGVLDHEEAIRRNVGGQVLGYFH
ncbi:40S ribosomal protein S15a-5-like [Hibiscus syriacus]|uniref:40S ribosomal protein S15a-5-like n=1 Tax=Hibiscus syriacus TaxID=106335 RepID=UPI001923964D|nr:40S ribosomal protein S15a-5-like [Hibiscus syriacus]